MTHYLLLNHYSVPITFLMNSADNSHKYASIFCLLLVFIRFLKARPSIACIRLVFLLSLNLLMGQYS